MKLLQSLNLSYNVCIDFFFISHMVEKNNTPHIDMQKCICTLYSHIISHKYYRIIIIGYFIFYMCNSITNCEILGCCLLRHILQLSDWSSYIYSSLIGHRIKALWFVKMWARHTIHLISDSVNKSLTGQQ